MQTMPIGEIVKLMERGQVTIPAKYRKKLGLARNIPLNVFEWRGMVVMVPVELKAKNLESKTETADWVKDTPQQYLQKVRYSPLEELWVKMVRQK